MKKIWIFIVIILVISSACLRQNNRICQELYKKELSIESVSTHSAIFLNDYKILIECKFEPIDYYIFVGPKQDFSILSLYVIMQKLNFLEENRKKFTYGDLCFYMEEFKKSKQYLEIREIVESSFSLLQKVATTDEWEKDSLILRKMNFESKTIVTIKELVKQNQKENITYAELLNINSEILFPKKFESSYTNDSIITKLPKGMISCVKGISAYDNFEIGIQKSKETKKPILLYFTGFACTNSRVVEEKVLMNSEIQSIINSNFVVVKLYVDDKTQLPEKETYFSEILNRKIAFKGEIAAELQFKKFNSKAQPQFIILNSEGKEIRSIGFTMSETDFKDFLLDKK